MPYNTRRKSLSLPMLGIQLPNSSSRSAAHRSPPSASAASPKQSQAQPQSKEPPTKKTKRAHTITEASPSLASPAKQHSRTTSVRFSDERQQRPRKGEQTPPPSPGRSSKVDTEGINDVIVVAVIEQLQKTGNRPHLLKELAAVLASQVPAIESSPNPTSIISSHLSMYMRRPWTALGPCPVAKELVNSHSKRIYYYLTSTPRQPIPEASAQRSLSAPNAMRVISPSLSSASDTESATASNSVGATETDDARSRVALSPSPELDLFLPDLNVPASPDPTAASSFPHSRRAASPALERDEREFTQTASFLQRRSRSAELERQRRESTQATANGSNRTSRDGTADPDTSADAEMSSQDAPEDGPEHEEESEESAALRNSEAAALLFGTLTEHASHPDELSGLDARATSKPSRPSVQSDDAISPGSGAPPSMDVAMDLDVVDAVYETGKTSQPWDAATELATGASSMSLGLNTTDLHGEWGEGWSSWAELKSPENVELDELDDLFGGY